MISLLDYGAGNVRSLRNAIHALGFSLTEIARPEDILQAERLIFPGVGAFGAAMERLHRLGYVEPLKAYLAAGRPFLGICIGFCFSYCCSICICFCFRSSNICW